MELPALTVSFDDGVVYEIDARPRDLLAVEKAGLRLDGSAPLEVMYTIALHALGRMQRAGLIPGDVELPATVDGLAEVADVEGKAEENPR